MAQYVEVARGSIVHRVDPSISPSAAIGLELLGNGYQWLVRKGGLLPGVTISTGPEDFQPIEQLQLMQFKDGRWQLFGDVISGELVH